MADEALRNLNNIDKNVHESARLMIIAVLSAVAEADFLYLLQATGLTKGNLPSHLSRLEAAGFIQIEKTFVGKTTRTVCRPTEEGRDALETYRQQMRAVL